VREKIADGALIAKWRKPGYENLCSILAIQKGDKNFGTTSLCRVPISMRSGHQARGAATRGAAAHARMHSNKRSAFAKPQHTDVRLHSHTRVHTTQAMMPDVKIGCITCASGDGQHGGPIWWNTPINAADFEKKGGKKRAAEEELDEDVKKRLAALAGGAMGGVD
jgi:bud site selection protein 31